MDPANNDLVNIKKSSNYSPEGLKIKNSQKISDKFDLSIIGKIDLAEAEKIASEEVIFLTESDLIEGLENFELVPVKSITEESSFSEKQNLKQSFFDIRKERESKPESLKMNENEKISDEAIIITEPVLKNKEIKKEENEETIKIAENEPESVHLEISDMVYIPDDEKTPEKNEFKTEDYSTHDIEKNVSDTNLDEIEEIIKTDITEPETDIILNEELPITKKLFTVKISEEILDDQLQAILLDDASLKSDSKIAEKYGDIIVDPRCKFIDDQYLIKPLVEDSVTYNEDPLTERLVKIIEVSDGKLELLEYSKTDEDFLNYVLEDYTLYNSEKFGTAFKEEIIYVDTDFEFIDNAIIRDDFTKYIHEIDDYFGSAEFLVQSEISEILGLIPDESDYIEDKLFGDYYKKYDLDNEIEFIKPEIDFFRSNYAGVKSLNYFSENKNSLMESEKISIEEDISSPNAIVFEEDISEIEEILKRNYNYKLQEKDEVKTEPEIIKADSEEITIIESILDITDDIIILEDKEKLNELASEYPEKHENLIKLLSYLDGLFEKLPEEVIRKFADSEYFELYSKVLKEMGV